MKLYATLENSRGKIVSISDNAEITATVYDGNQKAYSVIIEWCDVGDIIDDDGNELPESLKTKGAIVTVREWRNQPEEKRYKGINQCAHKQKTKTVHGKYCLDCHAYI